MKRIILMFIRNILLVPHMLIKLFHRAKHVDKYTEEEHFQFFRYIVKRANKGGNVTIQSSGQEHIPKEGTFMMFPNHQGLYDVLAIIDTCPRTFSAVFKKEVANVPMLKQVIQCMKAVAMDREDVRQSMKVIMDVENQVKNGRNFLIFPEGTRSKDGNRVGEFKGGSFKAATRAKCPIVPVALVDCFTPFDSNSIKPAVVQVHYLEPMYYEEYRDMKTTEIAQEVKRRIVEKIEQIS